MCVCVCVCVQSLGMRPILTTTNGPGTGIVHLTLLTLNFRCPREYETIGIFLFFNHLLRMLIAIRTAMVTRAMINVAGLVWHSW